ncbi:MAG: phosphoglycerate kinase [Chlamydiales bacterium]|nr:phosphoglycerate kinase [Chlamydiales bacterium]MCP5470408.1 phosphoglycerate kinase [Chlamydiales bacterium]
MTKLFIEDLPLKDKKVLVRVDFNVPLDQDLNVTDPTRIEAALPTIRYILDQGGIPILMSHFGRPKAEYLPELSLAPCARVLSKLLNRTVTMAPDCIGEEVEDLVDALKPGSLLLLENLRFHRAEKHPEEGLEFAQALAKLGDLYVNDAFGCCHRAHTSITALPALFPDRAAAGYLLKKEIESLDKLLKEPERPLVAIIGGAKISSKIGVLKALCERVDTLLIGGGMAYTFLKAQNIGIGNSLCENEHLETAKEIMAKAKKLLLPVDLVVVQEFSEDAPSKIVATIPPGYEGVDIGPKTVELFCSEIRKAKSILWNGPVGVFEFEPFAKGTFALARAVAESGAQSVVGGGDSIAALKKSGMEKKISHISTGGGATLEYIELGTLPGIEALTTAKLIH